MSDEPTVLATAECGVCAKPIEQVAEPRWQHADGNTYRHIVKPYFVSAVDTPPADDRAAALTTARARLLGAADEVIAQFSAPERPSSNPLVARLAEALRDVRRELGADDA